MAAAGCQRAPAGSRTARSTRRLSRGCKLHRAKTRPSPGWECPLPLETNNHRPRHCSAHATELPKRYRPELANVETIFQRCAHSAVFGIASSAGCSLVADRRECVRTTHRVIGSNALQPEGVLPKNGQGPIG